jgi:lactate permease
VIGALGTFVTGSDTNSNILFGKLQTIAASKLHIDPNWLAAATSGATENDFAAKHRHRGIRHKNGRSGQPDHVWHHEILLRLYRDPRLKVGLFYYWFMA